MTGDRIETAEDLDALPAQTVVGRAETWGGYTPAQRSTDDGRWYVPGSREHISAHALIPAVVLYRPDVPQPAPVTDLRADIEALDAWIKANQYAHFDEEDRDMGPCLLVQDVRAILAAHPTVESAGVEVASQPVTVTTEEQAAVFKVEGVHHFHGTKCLCGFDSYGRARSMTEHITGLTLAALGLGPARGPIEQVKCICSPMSGPEIECPRHGQCANEGHPCHCGAFGIEVSDRG